jgi:prolyl-tRNA synthetase
VSCDQCEYAANVEKAEIASRLPQAGEPSAMLAKLEKVATPGKRSVAEVAQFLKLPVHQFIKTLVYKTDADELVGALVRGDHEVNETKLKALLGCQEVALADDAAVRSATQIAPGFLGPIGMKLRMVADHAIQGMQEAVTGANEADAHYRHVDQRRDFMPSAFGDLRLARAGDPCPRCDSGKLEIHRGIEVGQVFYLGKKYSEAMGATFLDAEGREQNHDANGIIWPFPIAPFHVLLLPINYKDKALQEVCDRLFEELKKLGVEVLLDDRDERPGVKFKDADLIGIPLRITVGAKGLEKGSVELRWRRGGQSEDLPLAEAAERVRKIVDEALGA